MIDFIFFPLQFCHWFWHKLLLLLNILQKVKLIVYKAHLNNVFSQLFKNLIFWVLWGWVQFIKKWQNIFLFLFPLSDNAIRMIMKLMFWLKVCFLIAHWNVCLYIIRGYASIKAWSTIFWSIIILCWSNFDQIIRKSKCSVFFDDLHAFCFHKMKFTVFKYFFIWIHNNFFVIYTWHIFFS